MPFKYAKVAYSLASENIESHKNFDSKLPTFDAFYQHVSILSASGIQKGVVSTETVPASVGE